MGEQPRREDLATTPARMQPRQQHSCVPSHSLSCALSLSRALARSISLAFICLSLTHSLTFIVSHHIILGVAGVRAALREVPL